MEPTRHVAAAGDIPLVTPATMSPTYEQGQVRDAMITHTCPCSAASRKLCAAPGAPLSAVSGHKRYNTLHFASKVVCQQGCSAPLLDDPAQFLRIIWIGSFMKIITTNVCSISLSVNRTSKGNEKLQNGPKNLPNWHSALKNTSNYDMVLQTRVFVLHRQMLLSQKLGE